MVATKGVDADARELLETLESYLPSDRVGAISEALEFAIAAHEGQRRRSGEPYITHPIAVTTMLANLKMDAFTIEAGLLHDVVEDCDVSVEELNSRFSPEVGRLVEGATKIDQLPSVEGQNADAETLRKMFLAMAEDVRVVIIKLADRLHNMRTLEFLPPDRQSAIAQETRDIYAPLAARLGVWQFKWELEDLAFRYLEPEQYRRVASTLASKRSERENATSAGSRRSYEAPSMRRGSRRRCRAVRSTCTRSTRRSSATSAKARRSTRSTTCWRCGCS